MVKATVGPVIKYIDYYKKGFIQSFIHLSRLRPIIPPIDRLCVLSPGGQGGS